MVLTKHVTELINHPFFVRSSGTCDILLMYLFLGVLEQIKVPDELGSKLPLSALYSKRYRFETAVQALAESISSPGLNVHSAVD